MTDDPRIRHTHPLMSSKKLCKWSKKQIEKHMAELREQLETPTYVCVKCARAANDKKLLCKAIQIAAEK
ncbi:MAG: hypothetical protein ACOC45_03535 [Alkalispirochaetaceae bacterium]